MNVYPPSVAVSKEGIPKLVVSSKPPLDFKLKGRFDGLSDNEKLKMHKDLQEIQKNLSRNNPLLASQSNDYLSLRPKKNDNYRNLKLRMSEDRKANPGSFDTK